MFILRYRGGGGGGDGDNGLMFTLSLMLCKYIPHHPQNIGITGEEMVWGKQIEGCGKP